MTFDDLSNPASTAAAVGTPAQPVMWAIVELMGHSKIAGAVTQDHACGLALIRVDVPEVVKIEQVWRNGAYVPERRVIPSHSRSLGVQAIYSINWCDEAAARVAAHAIQHVPLRSFSLRSVLASLPEADRQELLALTAGSAMVSAVDDGDEHF